MEKKEMTISEINEMFGGTIFETKTEFLNTMARDWDVISSGSNLCEDFIREFQDKVDWRNIGWCQKLSEDFIREFQDKVNWDWVIKYQKLSESFIREFKDKVDWIYVSAYQKLSEDFIREFKDNVCWINISAFQKLSEEFIREFQDRVDRHHISKYQELSPEFREEFKDRLYSSFLIEDNWIYRDVEFKKREVMATGLYECHEDYFIAYKGIRKDRYSKFNFQYQYLRGETYESWCDCSFEENSFGLSVWTEEKATDYCNQLVIRVKVKYEDVGRVVHRGGKIRCFKFEVLD